MLQPPMRWLRLAASFIIAISTVGMAQAGERVESRSADVHQAADKRRAGSEDRILKLNVSTRGYPPYLIVEGNGNYSGIVYDVVILVAQRLGYTVEPYQIPRKRVDDLLLDGYIDATPRAREWTRKPERFLYTDSIVSVREVFFARVESDFHYRGPDSLRGLKLVTPLGYYYPKLQSLFEEGHIERLEVTDDRDMFTYLLHGRDIDAAVADLALGKWLIRQNDWRGKFRHSKNALSDYEYRLMLRPDWQDFADRFDRELVELKASGELEAIRNRYR